MESPRSRFAVVVLLAISVSLFAQVPASNRKFQVLDIRGTPYERGLQHGKLLRASIRKAVDTWKEDLRGAYHTDPDIFIKKFLAATDYVPAIEKWTPGLLQEVQGIAKGAGVDFTTMLVYQLPDEYWANGSAASGDHCSAIGAATTKDHPSIVAQNADLEGFRDGLQTILHITEPTGLEQFVLTAPGLIGFNGINSKGVGVAANTLTELGSSRGGLPVAFVVRGVLETVGFNEARSFLRTIRHASGQNYTLGGDGRVACFESSGSEVVQIDPPKAGSFVYHTNHSVAKRLLRQLRHSGQLARTVQRTEEAPVYRSWQRYHRHSPGDASIQGFGVVSRIPPSPRQPARVHLRLNHYGPRHEAIPDRRSRPAGPVRVRRLPFCSEVKLVLPERNRRRPPRLARFLPPPYARIEV